MATVAAAVCHNAPHGPGHHASMGGVAGGAHLARRVRELEQIVSHADQKSSTRCADQDTYCCCGERPWIIIPMPQNHVYGIWEVFTLCLLFFSAYFVPFDVLVLQEPEPSFAYGANLLLDLVFSVDVLINFRTAVEKAHESSSSLDNWETDWRAIALWYCAWPLSSDGKAGWFWIDVAAVAPVWISKLFFTYSKDTTVLRIVRLARLLRLGRLVDRFTHFVAMTGLSLNVMEVGKFIIYATLTFHWMACLNVKLQEIDVGDAAKEVILHDHQHECTWDAPGACAYTQAAYWALVTFTSVGYGDRVATSADSYVLCCILMLASAFVWAWIVGCIISILALVNSHADRFKQDVDELNDFCDSRCLPRNLASHMRHHMLKSIHMPKRVKEFELMDDRLSSELRLLVIREFRGKVLDGVWYCQNLHEVSKMELCWRMQLRQYGKDERIAEQHTLFHVKEGVCRINLKEYRKDEVWGQVHILLRHPGIIWSRSITFLEGWILNQKDLKAICLQFPIANRTIRKAQVRMVVSRGIQRFAAHMRRLDLASSWHYTYEQRGLPVWSNPGHNLKFEKKQQALRQHMLDLSAEVAVLMRDQLHIDDMVRQQIALAQQVFERLDELPPERAIDRARDSARRMTGSSSAIRQVRSTVRTTVSAVADNFVGALRSPRVSTREFD